jgi:hypothetical protein
MRAEPKEGGRGPEVVRALAATDAARLETDRVDAGCCSRAKAPLMAAAHKGAIIGRLGQQPAFGHEAERLLGSQPQADQRRDWERYPGAQRRAPL